MTRQHLNKLTAMWHALESARLELTSQERAYMEALEDYRKNDLFEWICPQDGHAMGGCQVYAHSIVGALNIPPIIDGKVTCPECGETMTVQEAQEIKDRMAENL